jgi:branched-chain amino acid aminotransferase
MMSSDTMAFDIHPAAAPVAAAVRDALLANPGFGRVFTDHMASITYTEGRGWHDARITARAPLQVDPASAVLHYAQEIFEGMKAYHVDNGAALFRPDANARRLNASARRMSMPELPEPLFLEAVTRLVEIDHAWIPRQAGASLYLRPFMIATEVFLGVKPSAEYLFMIIASPVGSYFKGGGATVSVWISQNDTRAAMGGNAAATTPPACAPRPRRCATAATRRCSSTPTSGAGWRSWAA